MIGALENDDSRMHIKTFQMEAPLLDIKTSRVAKVGNGWAQAQPIMSSAQPIFMIYFATNLCTFQIKIYE